MGTIITAEDNKLSVQKTSMNVGDTETYTKDMIIAGLAFHEEKVLFYQELLAKAEESGLKTKEEIASEQIDNEEINSTE